MHLVDAGPGDRYQEGRAFWQCSRAPICAGVHGAHPDGTPLGIPADRETNRARVEAHAAFDRLWRDRIFESRDDAYAWLRGALRITEEEGHIARFDIATCRTVVRFCQEFESRCTPTTSPLVNFFDDPWGLAPAGFDPDDLSMVQKPAPITTSVAPSCSSTDAVFVEQPDGW
jgi:hypothetical protein